MADPKKPLMVGNDPDAAEVLMRSYEESLQREQHAGMPAAADFPLGAETWPLCPLVGCGRPLGFVDTNEQGDIAFECLSGPLGVSHNYQAVYRVATQRFEPRPLYGADMERIPVERVIEMQKWAKPLQAAPAPPAPVAVRPELPPTLTDERPVALTPSGIAAMFAAGSSMSEIAEKFGISLAEVEASIRVAKVMAAEPAAAPPSAPPAAPAPPRRRRRQPEQSTGPKNLPKPPPEA